MLKILIVDDHPLFRRGIKDIVSESLEAAEVGEAGSAHQMIELVQRQHWDLVVMDITMPGRSGADALKDVKQLCPSLSVLVMSIHPEEQYAVRMFKAGADGYLTKAAAAEELVRAIRKILAGGKYVTPHAGERLATAINSIGEKPLHEKLSDREYRVLCMMATGKTLKEIADALSVSVNTVSTYRTRILEKMHMKTNAELTRYAVRNRLIE